MLCALHYLSSNTHIAGGVSIPLTSLLMSLSSENICRARTAACRASYWLMTYVCWFFVLSVGKLVSQLLSKNKETAAELLCCDSFPFNHIFWEFAKYRKGANLALPVGNQWIKRLQLQGAPWFPDQGLCPQTPVIGSRSALAMTFSP